MASGGFLNFIQIWLNIRAPILQMEVQWILSHLLTYNLLTMASFRIGVPSILFLLNESGVAFSVA